MGPSRLLAALLAGLALAAPQAAAQVEVDGEAAASSSAGAGRSSAASALGASALAPNLRVGAVLAPSATPGALALPRAAAAVAAPAPSAPGLHAAAVPAAPLPAAAEAAPPAAVAPSAAPDYVTALEALGVEAGLARRLDDFLSSRHPGDPARVYHGLAHSQEVAALAARLTRGAGLSPDKKILLIVAAALHDVDPLRAAGTPARVPQTLAYLDSAPEARDILAEFEQRFGFTAAQIKALILATDFSPDPALMAAKQKIFETAAAAAFPDNWGVVWGRRLAFAEQIATYVATPEQARRRVQGLAAEIRGPNGTSPSDADVLAGTGKFLQVLRDNSQFTLLSSADQAHFLAVLAYFQARPTPELWQDAASPAAARAPPVSPDAAAARRYIRGIAAGIALDDRQTDALLGDYFSDNGIPPGSARAAAVRRELLPARVAAEDGATAALNPGLQRHRAAILHLAAEYGVTPSDVQAALARRGEMAAYAALSPAAFERQADLALRRDALKRAVAGYPAGAAGDLLRRIAETMAVQGGKSVEEVARDGVFVYADFSGLTLTQASVGRDPDVRAAQMVFYVTRRDGRWRFDGYRQNRPQGRADADYVAALERWLVAGGVPARDLQ